MEMHNPAHPGEVLKEFYLPEGMGVSEAAKKLGVSRQTLSAIINGRAGISAEMAMRLSKALGTSPTSGSGCRCSMTCGTRSKSRRRACRSWRPETVCY